MDWAQKSAACGTEVKSTRYILKFWKKLLRWTKVLIFWGQVAVTIAFTYLQPFEQWIKERIRHVCLAYIASIVDCKRIKNIIKFNGVLSPDGMPLVWLGRLKDIKYSTHLWRIWWRQLVKWRTGYRHYFYGVEPTPYWPKLLENFGADSGQFFHPCEIGEKEDQDILDQVNHVRYSLGRLGSPSRITGCPAPGFIECASHGWVGAAFDFIARTKKQAPLDAAQRPRWIFRLCSEPGRLWRRSHREYKFIWFLLLDVTKTYSNYGSQQQNF